MLHAGTVRGESELLEFGRAVGPEAGSRWAPESVRRTEKGSQGATQLVQDGEKSARRVGGGSRARGSGSPTDEGHAAGDRSATRNADLQARDR